MSKDPNFSGQPIFSQLLSLIDKRKVDQIAKESGSDRYTKKFDTYSHLITMLYCIYHKCSSLREVTTGMQACFTKLNHLGMRYCPRRSTISDANIRRDEKVFESIYISLYRKLGRNISDSRMDKKWYSRLYFADSTTISLFKEILKCAGNTPSNGKRKGGMKVHALTKADQDVPCFVKMTSAATADVGFIKNMRLPERSIIVFDKGYNSYSQYELWSQQNVYWVTRKRKVAVYEVTDEMPLSEESKLSGVVADQLITLGHTTTKQVTRTKARLITYYDAEKNKLFEFITNIISHKPETIALIYKKRWQIELLFKRLKQNYPLQYFLGDNANAIKIQVWCVLIADLILHYVKNKLKRKWSYSNLSSMVRLHLMTYINLFKFLNNPEKALINTIQPKPKTIPLFSSA